MKKPFFARHALLVLTIVFFFVPFAMRGSRYAVQRMKNDVKDWLPSDFPETAELNWFRQRFLGEQFVVISWDGCHGTQDDQRFQAFVDRLFPQSAPSTIQANSEPHRPGVFIDANGLYSRSYMPESTSGGSDTYIGNRLKLHANDEVHLNWGGLREKWIRAGRNDWVYITPKGELYQWKANRSWPAQLGRAILRATSGKQLLQGELVTSFGPIDGPWYYEDPTRLNARLFKSITTGPSVLGQLTESDGISRDEAHNRLRGIFFGEDDQQTCIVVTLTEAAKDDPRALVGRGILGKERGALLDIAESSGLQAPRPPPALPGFLAGLLPEDSVSSDAPMLRLGGPPVDNAAIDEEGQITLVRLLGLSLAVGLGLSWLCFRSINITIMVFLVGGISAVTSVGIVYWTGSQLDAVLMSMPSLVYVLGISGAVHVVNYYRESVTDTGMSSAPDRAVKLGLWPCTMAAFTTSLGLMSLSASNIMPIKKFGMYSAIGVIATLVLLFTYLPAGLEMWPPRRYLNRSSRQDGSSPASAIERFLDRFWQGVGRLVIRRYRIVACLCLATLIIGGFGVTKISTDVQLLKLFDSQAKIIEDYQWLEANLGKLVPMELVVRIHPDLFEPSALEAELQKSAEASGTVDQDGRGEDPTAFSFLERMEVAKHIASELYSVFGEQGSKAMSRPMLASTFVRESPTSGNPQLRKGARKTFSRNLEQNRAAFVENDFLCDDPVDEHELWRISLRLAALDDIDFGTFVQDAKSVVEPIMLAYEYREHLVRRLEQYTRKRPAVYLVGYQPPNEAKTAVDTGTAAGVEQIDQTRIFQDTLIRLLKAEDFRVGGIMTAEHMEDSAIKPTDGIVELAVVPGVSTQMLNATRAFRLDAKNHSFDPYSDATARDRSQKVSVVYTGLVPIVYKAQRTLLTSLIQSTGLAFVMIAGVMILLLRSPRAGLISMFPNVFPVIVVFGYMGLKEFKVDIGSMMTASVAMGVAVDDTIHFLSWFRKGLDEGHDRKQSILLAYRRVATAMTQTTAIGGVGLSIFAFSTFTPTQQFGTLMLALLAAALVGDLLFLPALLASSLGRVFDRGRDMSRKPDSAPTLSTPHIAANTARIETENTTSHSKADKLNLPRGMRRDNSH